MGQSVVALSYFFRFNCQLNPRIAKGEIDVASGQRPVGLKRTLTFFELIMASIAGIFGSGWLFGAFYAARDAGPSSILAWVIGAIAIGLMALVFAELGGRIPDAGGVARYPQYSHGRFMSFVVSWAAYIGYAATPPIESAAVMQ